MINKLNKKITYILMLVYLTISTSACATDVKVPVDSKASVVIAYDKNGDVVTMKGINHKGEIGNFSPCALCTSKLSKKFGTHCEELIKNDKKRKKIFGKLYGKKYANAPICKATTNVSLQGKAGPFLFTRHNPHCIVKIKDGDEIVFVYPADCLQF